jgi:site-specific DNA recombinase
MLMALIVRVDLNPDRVEIKMRRRGLVELLNAQSTALSTQGGKCHRDSEDTLTLKVKARLQRAGREMRMLVENANDQTLADPAPMIFMSA